jgi:hypothetical protein
MTAASLIRAFQADHDFAVTGEVSVKLEAAILNDHSPGARLPTSLVHHFPDDFVASRVAAEGTSTFLSFQSLL